MEVDGVDGCNSSVWNKFQEVSKPSSAASALDSSQPQQAMFYIWLFHFTCLRFISHSSKQHSVAHLWTFLSSTGFLYLFLFSLSLSFTYYYFWSPRVLAAARGLSPAVASRAALHCGVQASHCGGFSCCRAQALGTWASVFVARGP